MILLGVQLKIADEEVERLLSSFSCWEIGLILRSGALGGSVFKLITSMRKPSERAFAVETRQVLSVYNPGS